MIAPALASVTVLHVSATSRRLPRSCVRMTPVHSGRVTAVIRNGPLLRSVTLRADGDDHVYGCDATGVRFEGRPWCGIAAGTLRHGRVTDPRLVLFCRVRHGRRVAAAWINATRRTKTVVVEGTRYAAAGGLPIRVAVTREIDYGRARATIRIREYDAREQLVARRVVRARVSG